MIELASSLHAMASKTRKAQQFQVDFHFEGEQTECMNEVCMVLFSADGWARKGRPIKEFGRHFFLKWKKMLAIIEPLHRSAIPHAGLRNSHYPSNLGCSLHMFPLRNSFGAVKDKRFNMEGKKT